MKITRLQNGYTIRCSDHEFDILGIAVDQIEMADTTEFLAETGHRRSWARRVRGGLFLRIDKDKRTDA